MSRAGKLILGERSPFLKCGTVGDVAEVIAATAEGWKPPRGWKP